MICNQISTVSQQLLKFIKKFVQNKKQRKHLIVVKIRCPLFSFSRYNKVFILQYNSKTAATSGNIFYRDRSLAQIQDLFYKGKSKTVSLLFMGTVALVKFVKNMFHGVFTDLGPFVFYGKTDLFPFRHHPDIDRTTTGTEFDGIGKQIVPYMADEILISQILHIYHVHIKDVRLEPAAGQHTLLDTKGVLEFASRSWNFVTPGTGHDAAWWRRFLETLQDCGYDGALSIEQEDYTIPLEEALQKAVSLLRQALPA